MFDSQELLDNVESLCALDRPAAGGANANLSGGLLDTRAYRIKRSQLQVRVRLDCSRAAVDGVRLYRALTSGSHDWCVAIGEDWFAS